MSRPHTFRVGEAIVDSRGQRGVVVELPTQHGAEYVVDIAPFRRFIRARGLRHADGTPPQTIPCKSCKAPMVIAGAALAAGAAICSGCGARQKPCFDTRTKRNGLYCGCRFCAERFARKMSQ